MTTTHDRCGEAGGRTKETGRAEAWPRNQTTRQHSSTLLDRLAPDQAHRPRRIDPALIAFLVLAVLELLLTWGAS